ncbi:beta-N-acetylhexosaminidase [Yinghuangia seranimata]|uniref:beta-N-acetylhexosaminidase n=1 Tax=Yinghuangia seranimata TaxID=408067 RepID=UPI00248B9150|nr:beta-N-acetylhexosaminidase [Yinghuangia seranimata]MDI2125197.1 beta-N-acetylhexosaminidase [Yinghuangia seranimata]
MTPPAFEGLVPAPLRAAPAPGVTWTLGPDTRIHTSPGSAEAARIGRYLAELLRPATGFALPVEESDDRSGIALVLDATVGAGDVPGDGDEGYRMEVAAGGVVVRASHAAGLFYGVQSLRQVLPAQIESATRVDAAWVVAGGSLTDKPRYAYRGLSLDIARHFFTPEEVKRFVDDLARYKFNHLHLHLTDDQGWRIAIDGRPKLTGVGASTQVGGGKGGFWTQDDYRVVVAYAADRFVTVVPEIDMPGHTNAALVAYPELGCDGKTYKPYTGTQVGFSSLCVENEQVYAFLDEVVGQIAALTPGPYVHIGGDEAHTLTPARYKAFMARAQKIVEKHGKQVMAWHQLAGAAPVDGAVLEYWNSSAQDASEVAAAAKAGAKVVMAPADHVYLDMAYAGGEKRGVTWAGTVSVKQSYQWEPSTHLKGVPEDAVVGVEAALWGETIRSMDDAEYLVYPRLPGVAEAAWSPRDARDWDAYQPRLANQKARWDLAGVNYARHD